MSRAQKRRRRRHGAAFKAEAVLACQAPGVSLSAVALERQINANLLRRWVKEATGKTSLTTIAASAARAPAFVPVAISAPRPAESERPIRLQVRRRSLRVTIEWPTSAAQYCALWLKELLG